jgi:hypothetical protein
MKRVNKADIQTINSALNTIYVARLMLKSSEDVTDKRLWAESGFSAMETLKEYGIFAGAGSKEFWTETHKAYKA